MTPEGFFLVYYFPGEWKRGEGRYWVGGLLNREIHLSIRQCGVQGAAISNHQSSLF